MRTTGLGFSAVLVAVGAILAWAVTERRQETAIDNGAL